jgi:endothelin-converting enzyme/putative endopeptidase
MHHKSLKWYPALVKPMRLSCALMFVAQAAFAQTSEMPLPAFVFSLTRNLGNMDRVVEPCTDCYRHSCGGWSKKNPDRGSWTAYAKLCQDDERFRRAFCVTPPNRTRPPMAREKSFRVW